MRRVLISVAMVGSVTACGGSGGPAATPTTAGSTTAGTTTSAPPPTPARTGVAGMAGTEIVDAAYAALTGAPSVTVVIVHPGNPVISVVSSLTRTSGSAVIRSPTGVREIRKVGSMLYRRAGADYWRLQGATAAVAARLAGRWVRSPVDAKQTEGDRTFVDLEYSASVFTGDDTATTGRLATIGTQPAVKVVTRADDGSSRTLWVAATGPAYPLRFEAQVDGFAVQYLQYGQPVTVDVPPAGQVVDGADLGF